MKTEFAFGSVGNLPIGLDGRPASVSPCDVRVYDADTEEEILGVIACDAQAGWLVRQVLKNGRPQLTPDKKGIVSERVSGNFAIVAKNA